MPDKLRFNKEKIDQKLAELTFCSDDQVWNEFIEFHQKTKKKTTGFKFRFDAKYLLFPFSIAIISLIVYLSVNNIRSQNINQNPFIGEEDHDLEKTLVEEITLPKPNQPNIESKKTTLIDSVNQPKKDADTIIALKEISDSLFLKTENDTSIKLTFEEKEIKQDTSEHKKKKSKRKKNKNAAVSSDVFTHHPEDDQIIIPE